MPDPILERDLPVLIKRQEEERRAFALAMQEQRELAQRTTVAMESMALAVTEMVKAATTSMALVAQAMQGMSNAMTIHAGEQMHPEARAWQGAAGRGAIDLNSLRDPNDHARPVACPRGCGYVVHPGPCGPAPRQAPPGHREAF